MSDNVMLKRILQPFVKESDEKSPQANRYIVPAWWGPLYRDAARVSVFVSEHWLQTWVDVYGTEFAGHWIHWEANGVIVGGCLVLVRAERKFVFSLRSLYFNATANASERTPFSEFNDVLWIDPYRDAIADDLVTFLRSQKWDRLYVSGYEPGGVLHRVCDNLLAASIDLQCIPATFVNIANLRVLNCTIESTLSVNTRAQIARSVRLYEQQYGPLNLQRAGDVGEALDFLAQLALLHNERRGLKGEQGTFENQFILAFHRQLIARFFDSGEVDTNIDILKITAGTHCIGYLYNFVQGGKVCFFQSGFYYDSEQRAKPGLVAHVAAIRHYIDTSAVEYDFLAGDNQYKRSISKTARLLYWAVVNRDTLRVRLLLQQRKIWQLARRFLNKPA